MTNHMTTKQEQAIRERLANITPGEWEQSFLSVFGDVVEIQGVLYHRPICDLRNDDAMLAAAEVQANVQFIAHSPADIRLLLEEIDALRARRDEALEQAAKGAPPP